MKHGLLAPQFGIGGPGVPGTEDAVSWTLGPAAQTPHANGPTVVVKRRRLLPEGDAPSGESAVPQTLAKAPKVYRLALPAASPLAQQLDVQTAGAARDPETSVVSSRLRRRDPVRAPTLVKHVVYETSAPLHKASGSQPTERHDGPTVGGSRVRDALKELDEVLASTARAQNAYLALDELLTSLGIARGSA